MVAVALLQLLLLLPLLQPWAFASLPLPFTGSPQTTAMPLDELHAIPCSQPTAKESHDAGSDASSTP